MEQITFGSIAYRHDESTNHASLGHRNIVKLQKDKDYKAELIWYPVIICPPLDAEGLLRKNKNKYFTQNIKNKWKEASKLVK